MVNEKRLIDVKHLSERMRKKDGIVACTQRAAKIFDSCYSILMHFLETEPTVDAVEVDTVIEMFEYMLGDCPCNFSPVDEWLAERCELQEECPNPEDKRGCWKQFIKHFCAEMDGDGNE